MLRRKLLTRLGLLICAFVVGAIGAMWALQDVLNDIDRVNSDAESLIDGILSIDTAMNRIESPAFLAGGEPTRSGAAARESDHGPALRAELVAAVRGLGSLEATRGDGEVAQCYARLVAATDPFLDAWTSPERVSGAAPTAAALRSSLALQTCVQELGTRLRALVSAEQVAVGRYFRLLVLTLTLLCLVMMNVSIVVLLRIAQMILRPVTALVEGSRELAAERFDHRVQIEQDDEFGELAHAYNRLAEQLQANEARRTETLRQLAVTLNHGLNNAMSIIEMQLGLLDRQAGGSPTLTRHLREIRGSLTRMAEIVASLKNIRRVVLVDYVPGQKMIDLERSVAEEQDSDHGAEPSPRPEAGRPGELHASST
ncbi:MAG: HAMP domain-containing protein [Phycisphaerales bacterium]